MSSALSATTNRCIELSRQAHTVGLATSGLRGAGRGSRGNSGAPPSGEGTTWQPTLRSQQPCLSATATYTSARGRPRPFRAAPVAQQPWLRSSHCAARSRPSAPCHNNLHPHHLAVINSSWRAGAEKGRGRARQSPTAERPSPSRLTPSQDGIGAASAQPIRRLGRRTPRSPLLGARTRCPLRPERPLVAAPGH